MAWFGRFWSRDAETSAMFGNVAPSEGGSQGYSTRVRESEVATRKRRDCIEMRASQRLAGSHGVRASAVREGLTTKDEAVC